MNFPYVQEVSWYVYNSRQPKLHNSPIRQYVQKTRALCAIGPITWNLETNTNLSIPKNKLLCLHSKMPTNHNQFQRPNRLMRHHKSFPTT